MTEHRALASLYEKSDTLFFQYHRDRKAHIRQSYDGECEDQFRTLGFHKRGRRRILLLRTDFEGKPFPDGKVLKLPFLAFSDETIEDRDDVLLPIIKDIMYDAKDRISQ